MSSSATGRRRLCGRRLTHGRLPRAAERAHRHHPVCRAAYPVADVFRPGCTRWRRNLAGQGQAAGGQRARRSDEPGWATATCCSAITTPISRCSSTNRATRWWCWAPRRSRRFRAPIARAAHCSHARQRSQKIPISHTRRRLIWAHGRADPAAIAAAPISTVSAKNDMSEALKVMALEGHGLAWLPRAR